MENTRTSVSVATFTDAVEGEGFVVQAGSVGMEDGGWGVWSAAEILPTPPWRAPLLGGDFLV
jgi:hypothetical protein